MSATKEYILKLIDEFPEKDLPEILNYIEYIKTKKSNLDHLDLQNASESSISFWDNEIDDEVWNDV